MIDSHCHLAGEEYAADLPEVVERATTAGVAGALVILSAGDRAEAERAGRVRALWPAVGFAIGIHPHHAGAHANDLDGSIDALDGELTAQRAVAVGEIGLDYHYDFSPREIQREVFERQLALARRRRLPVVIHTREATEDTFDILRTDAQDLRLVFHCFTGDRAMAGAALDLDAWLSFAGIVTFPRAEELREVARMVPANRYLAETDSPYLAPVPFRGKRNEPSHVIRVIEVLAEVRGQTRARTAAETTANVAAVFGAIGSAGSGLDTTKSFPVP